MVKLILMRMSALILRIPRPVGRTLERRSDSCFPLERLKKLCNSQAAGEEGEEKGGAAGNVERRSTRAWAQDSGYNTQKLFQKFFNDDIK